MFDRNSFVHSEGAWSHDARQKADKTPNSLPLGAANTEVKDLPSGCVSTRRGAELSPEPCLFWAITLKMYTVAGIKFWIVTCISPGWLVFSTRSLWVKKGFERNWWIQHIFLIVSIFSSWGNLIIKLHLLSKVKHLGRRADQKYSASSEWFWLNITNITDYNQIHIYNSAGR